MTQKSKRFLQALVLAPVAVLVAAGGVMGLGWLAIRVMLLPYFIPVFTGLTLFFVAFLLIYHRLTYRDERRERDERQALIRSVAQQDHDDR